MARGRECIGDRERRQWDSACDGSDCGGYNIRTGGPHHRMSTSIHILCRSKALAMVSPKYL